MVKICITAKVNPDLDGVACALGYEHFLKLKGIDAQACIFGTPQSEVQYFIKKHNVSFATLQNTLQNMWDSFILVDASSMKGMPHVVQADLVQEIIDHRLPSEAEKEFPAATIQNELVGAAATLVTERFMQEGKVPEKQCALLLYAAIYHNTLNFITSNTTDRDRKAAQFLEDSYGFSQDLVRQMFDYASQDIISNLSAALIADAKQFGTFNFYQLVMSGVNPQDLEETVLATINQEDSKHPCSWSILNVVDVTQKISFLCVPSKIGQEIVAQKMGCHFDGAWATVPAMLRKEIMPLISYNIRC